MKTVKFILHGLLFLFLGVVSFLCGLAVVSFKHPQRIRYGVTPSTSSVDVYGHPVICDDDTYLNPFAFCSSDLLCVEKKMGDHMAGHSYRLFRHSVGI
ncbi:hypothetical protein AN477_08425 [Alicyclobacillus ferrooxydans]|uniref:Uncharacterized protein n=1 Tax=Alicyclobacillus ferrooxydans TaxID=471514 RepID=A0A0P9CEP9_9BACL|nr:hypothetical protein AN477_08425 [Alicyclobacillus ferrooxydans]